jgi:polyisoprenoid-binding protein YceI
MAQATRVVNGVELPPVGRYELDLAHTTLDFVARHMLTKVRGRFTEFTGWIDIAEDPEASRTEIQIEAGSIQTNTEQRDAHLKSGDFLLIEKYPTLTFASAAVRPTGGSRFELDGDLTIKGITRPVTLSAEFVGWGPNHEGTPMVSFSARTTIDREDWDMTWNMVVETGGFLVGKKVDLEIEVEALRNGG